MKQFWIKLFIFFIAILAIQNVIGYYFPYKPSESIEKLNLAKKEKTSIIYFGDSTTTWYSKYDVDQRSLPVMLGSTLSKNQSVVGITHNSYAPFLYDAYTKYLVEQGYYPNFIIIPINVKTFSPASDLRPQNQFTDELLYLHLRNTSFAPFLTFLLNIGLTDVNRVYDNIYQQSPIYDGDKIVGNGKEFDDKLKNSTLTTDQIKTMLQLYYMGRIHPDHRNLRALIQIADRYKNTRTKVIFYVTPIDRESGNKYLGKRFENQIKENIATIMSTLNKHNATVVDLSLTQPAKNFTWHEVTYVNEHLNQTGRLFIIKSLTPLVDQTLVEKK